MFEKQASGATCGLSLSFVLIIAQRVFLWFLQFSSLFKEPTFQILIQPGNSGQEEPPCGMSSDEFHSHSPPIPINTMRCNLHCPPATHLIPIHHRQTIVVWWYTWRKDTWLFFLRRRKNICQKNKPQLALIWRVLMQRLANNICLNSNKFFK